MLRSFAALAIALFSIGAHATTYTYTGGTYTAPIVNETTCAAPQSCGQFTTGQRLTGSFTTASPLAPNLNNQNIVAILTGYSFNNGVSTLTQGAASRIDTFQVSTDATGAITSATIFLHVWTYSPAESQPAGPHAEGDRLDSIVVDGASASYAYINLWCSASNIGTASSGATDVCRSAGTDTSSSLAQAGLGTWATVPDISIANASIAEGNTGSASLTFNVTLSAAPTAPVSVNWSTADGTATGGVDYVAGAGTLSWTIGDALTKTITIQVNGDTTVEPDETLSVALSAPTGATLAGAGKATGTILNDDLIAPVASLTSVPTLSEWSLMLLTVACAMLGMGKLRRRS